MYNNLHEALFDWYQKNGRHDLPWRQTNDPYFIWISEVMLQQTQVKTVLERFYFPFLEVFPTLEDLASAHLDDVLKKWEGLGYYTRARNLHSAAVRCQGKFPDNAHDLQKLPGIGRSTAHAIAAFAYREPLPILDANVKRILHRFFALSTRNEKLLWEKAYRLFDATKPFEYNQAMMDVGSMICTPKSPRCDECPFSPSCAGKSDPLSYPAAKSTSPKPIRYKTILVAHSEDKLALQQRMGRFLHGLWGFVEKERFIPPHSYHFLGSLTQHYTHFTLDTEVYSTNEPLSEEGLEWFEISEISSLSLSRADHKVLHLLRYNTPSMKRDG